MSIDGDFEARCREAFRRAVAGYDPSRWAAGPPRRDALLVANPAMYDVDFLARAFMAPAVHAAGGPGCTLHFGSHPTRPGILVETRPAEAA